MKNPFDPFGVFSEWKGQEPEEELTQVEVIVEQFYEEHSDNLYNVIHDAVTMGVFAERERCLAIIKQELSAEDRARIIKLIEEPNE